MSPAARVLIGATTFLFALAFTITARVSGDAGRDLMPVLAAAFVVVILTEAATTVWRSQR